MVTGLNEGLGQRGQLMEVRCEHGKDERHLALLSPSGAKLWLRRRAYSSCRCLESDERGAEVPFAVFSTRGGCRVVEVAERHFLLPARLGADQETTISVAGTPFTAAMPSIVERTPVTE